MKPSAGCHFPAIWLRGEWPKSSQSIIGYYWYLRLRGHEIDAVDFDRKSFGNTYALQKQTNDARELAKLLMKLCEKTGRRLRRAKYSAQGVHVACVYTDLSYWHIGRKFDVPIYTTRDIYIKALRLLNMSGYTKRVRNLAVSVYDLIPSTDEQLELFASPAHAVAEAMDEINLILLILLYRRSCACASCLNGKSRAELHAIYAVRLSTTKSDGMWKNR